MRTPFLDATLQNEQRVPLSKTQMISITYISYGITVYPTDDDCLTLREYFNDDDPDIRAVIVNDGQNLSIRHGAQRLFGMTRGAIEIDLPKSFFGTLNMQTVSGKIDIRGRLSLDEFNASSTSGKIAVGEATAGSAVLSSVSGAIVIGMLRANCNLHTTSGAIRVGCAAGGGVYKTVSGAIDAGYETVLSDIRMRSTSGKIQLSMPAGYSFAINAKSVSGGIHTDFPVYLENSGKHSLAGQVGREPGSKVDLSTVSGKIEVWKG